MSQKIAMPPEAVLQVPNYAIKEIPSEADLEKYTAVIENYIAKTRGWSKDQYEIEVAGLGVQKAANQKDGIVFNVNDLINRLQKEKEYQETGGYSTGAGRSIRVLIHMPSMQVIQEFRQF